MHAEELGDPIPEKPVIFNKFGSIAHRVQPDKPLDLSDILPTDKGPVHYEAEICLQLGVRPALIAASGSKGALASCLIFAEEVTSTERVSRKGPACRDI